jgi:hypothetical protein
MDGFLLGLVVDVLMDVLKGCARETSSREVEWGILGRSCCGCARGCGCVA